MEDEKQRITRDILSRCSTWATPEQRQMIEAAVVLALLRVRIEKEETALSTEFAESNDKYLNQFLAIKMIKGLSEASLVAYRNEVKRFLDFVGKPVPSITTNDIRVYLAKKKIQDKCSNVTIDNARRFLRSFFDVMWKEHVIAENPAAMIDEIKKEKQVKKPFSEEELEAIRDACENPRDKALVETLYSTGCRVSEVSGMNWSDMDGDQITVLGKGNKERVAYLNVKAKRALMRYRETRTDSNDAVFVSMDKPFDRLGKCAIEARIRELGKSAGVENCHPHRFRRTAATVALNRGMPIDQVSKMLGHESLNTTQIYAKTNTDDVQHNHRKYLT